MTVLLLTCKESSIITTKIVNICTIPLFFINLPAICTGMELEKRYSVEYKGLKNSAYDLSFEVDDALFAHYESRDIKGGNCLVKATMLKSDSQLDFDFEISGSVVCECDRCLEDCAVAIEYKGHLLVRLSDAQGEYDGEVMWLSPSENEVNLTQYIYESIVLSLPYQRVHPEGECDPDMIARFSIISAEELATLEAQAQGDSEGGIAKDDFNKLAALKAQLEDEAAKN